MDSLAVMLRGMAPVLFPDPYGFTGQAAPVAGAFAMVAEEEGLTVVAPVSVVPADVHWARISLALYSDLAAVGLTAAFARVLAEAGISANVIAGLHHDHIFVPWARREEAVAVLERLARDA